MRSTPFLISVTFLCLCIICSSCVRENLEINEPSEPLYIGSWELRFTDGSMGHHDYPPGIGHTLLITKDSIIEKVNHERVYATTYQVSRDTSYYFGEPRLMDEIIRGDGYSFFFAVTQQTFTKYSGIPAADGGSSTFGRVMAID